MKKFWYNKVIRLDSGEYKFAPIGDNEGSVTYDSISEMKRELGKKYEFKEKDLVHHDGEYVSTYIFFDRQSNTYIGVYKSLTD